MAFEQVVALDCDTTISLGGINKKTGKPNPTKVEGYFLGTRKVPSAMSNTGSCNLHVFQTPEGNTGVWGKTDLDNKLAQAKPGLMVRATYKGTKPTKKQPMFVFLVEIDKENYIDVSSLSGNSTEEVGVDSGAEDETGDPGYYPDPEQEPDETDLQDDPPPADVVKPARATAPAKPAARAPSADAQAKVNALLAKARANKPAA